MNLISLIKAISDSLKQKEEFVRVSDDLRIGNLPRSICPYDGNKLELLFENKKGTSIPRGIYYCSLCRTVYDLPVR